MAHEYEELNSRRRQRSQRQNTRQYLHRRGNRRVLAVAAVFALLLAAGIFLMVQGCQSTAPADTRPPQSQNTQSTGPTVPAEGQTVITIAAAGDLNVTDLVVASGEQNGSYDFTDTFLDIAPLFADADAAVLNFEGNLCGSPFGTDSASAPQALAEALKRIGVDFVQVANSFTVHNGLTGLSSTLDGLRAAGLQPLGAYSSREAYAAEQGFTIRNIGGIRVAFVAFTKGVGSLGLPAGSQDQVNLLYTDYSSTYRDVDTEGITAVLQAVRAQKPDVTVAMLHWGSEYNDKISDTQTEIVELMLSQGVDAILGSHPHYVQQLVYDEAKGQVVAYSLGDFCGDGEKAGTAYSIVLELEITRDNATGQTKITGCSYEPVYILRPQQAGEKLRLLRLRDAMAMYENDHVSKVSAETYEAMKYALQRIEARVAG